MRSSNAEKKERASRLNVRSKPVAIKPLRARLAFQPTGNSSSQQERRTGMPAFCQASQLFGWQNRQLAGLTPLVSCAFVSCDNRTPVKTPAEFHAALNSTTGPVTLRLHTDRPGEARTIVVRE